MIEHFRDYAANERTYLAWVRTDITVMALGFIVAKFELFLIALHKQLGTSGSPLSTCPIRHEFVSLAFIVLGIIMIVVATIRYFINKKMIDEVKLSSFGSIFFHILLSVFMVIFGLYLIICLSNVF